MICLVAEAMTRHSLPPASQSTLSVSPSQQRHRLSYERSQPPDYELAIQHLNERRQQNSQVRSLDCENTGKCQLTW